MGECEWFLKCHNDAIALVEHPTIGDVPICNDHLEWLLDGPSPTKFVPPIVARHVPQQPNNRKATP